jgi:PDZ domain-containing protein
VTTILDFVHERERDQLKRSLLHAHPLLARCPLRVIRRVASIADEVAFAPGEVLAEQGRSAEWFFLIHSGTAGIARDGTPLGVVGAGEYYGEVPLLGRGMHPATVTAITPMRAFVIGCQRFLPLVDDVRSIREDLQAALARQPDLVALARAERAKRIGPVPGIPRLTRPWAVRTPLRRRPRRAAQAGLVPGRSPRLRAVRASVVAAVVAAVLAIAALYHPPYGVIRPGPVIDVSHDVEISGAVAHPARGRYLLLTVRADRPSLLELGVVALQGHKHIEHMDRTAPGSAADLRRQLNAEFVQSQRDAATAAAAALGMSGATPGRLPFTVRFRHRDVVGPSGGLVYALAIEDMLTGTDVAHGRVVAATGALDAAGDVLPVGYLSEKATAARRAGAQVLLTPESEAYEAAGAGVPVTGVSSVKDALARLADPKPGT